MRTYVQCVIHVCIIGVQYAQCNEIQKLVTQRVVLIKCACAVLFRNGKHSVMVVAISGRPTVVMMLRVQSTLLIRENGVNS